MKRSKSIKITKISEEKYGYDSATGFKGIVNESQMVSLLSILLMSAITEAKTNAILYVEVELYDGDDDI